MTSCNGKAILILEDEFILAWEAEEILKDAGASVLGPTYNIPAALKLIQETSRIDAAVLDININGAESTPVASELKRRGVPFVYTTGYGADTPRAGEERVLDKPYSAAALVKTLSEVMSQSKLQY